MPPPHPDFCTGYLSCALTNMFECGTTLRETTVVMERIRLATPKMMKIWSHSPMAKKGRNEKLKGIAKVEREILDQIAQGKFTMDDKVMPELQPSDS
jgi:hypothetical protein